jgi:hypothetical protein
MMPVLYADKHNVVKHLMLRSKNACIKVETKVMGTTNNPQKKQFLCE